MVKIEQFEAGVIILLETDRINEWGIYIVGYMPKVIKGRKKFIQIYNFNTQAVIRCWIGSR